MAATALTTFSLSVAVSPNDPDVLYAGTFSGIAKSVNGGASFTTLQLFFQEFTISSFNTVNSVVLDPRDAQTIYLGTTGGVAKTVNGGTTWVGLGFTPGTGFPNPRVQSVSVNRLFVDPNNRQTLYAATQNNLFKSTNGGTT